MAGDEPTVRPARLAREFTDTELGVEHVACPAEIREMFRWKSNKVAVKIGIITQARATSTRLPAKVC